MLRRLAPVLALPLLAAAPPSCGAPPPAPPPQPSAAPAIDGPSTLVGAEALQPFFKALAALKSGARKVPVQILQIGDSHTAADLISSGVRARLQARFGEGGRGALPPGAPFKGYAPRQVDVIQSDGWTLYPSFPRATASGVFGLAGWRLVSNQAGASLTLNADPEATFDKAVVCGLAGPGAGGVTMAAGGTSVVSSFAAEKLEPRCIAVDLPPRSKQLQLTASAAPVTLLSFATWRASGGLVLANLGVSGTELTDFAARDDAAVQTELAAYQPDLIVLAFGTNDAFRPGVEAAAYEAQVRAQIRRLKHFAPAAAILVVGPPDAELVRPDIPEDGVHDLNFACAPLTEAETAHYADLVAAKNPALARWYEPPGLAAVRQAEAAAAAAEGAAFWDWGARLGGPCAAHRLSRPDQHLMRGDHIHFTSDGAELVAAMLSRDLLAAYDTSVGGH